MSSENAVSLPARVHVLPRIRKAHPSDRAALWELIAGDELFTAQEARVALELIDDALAESGEYFLLVAEVDGRLRGYVCYGDTPMTEHTWDLFWLVTHKDVRGRGVARALVTAMERDVRERGGRLIRVETSNLYHAAAEFYSRMGYPVVTRVRDFYRPGDDLLMMIKHL
jgi:ribosomal protein S18 acetylase RimI-like enzyme